MTTEKSKAVSMNRMEVKDGRLIINVALTDGVQSGSGKSIVYFTTGGNVGIDGGYKIGVNLYKSKK